MIGVPSLEPQRGRFVPIHQICRVSAVNIGLAYNGIADFCRQVRFSCQLNRETALTQGERLTAFILNPDIFCFKILQHIRLLLCPFFTVSGDLQLDCPFWR